MERMETAVFARLEKSAKHINQSFKHLSKAILSWIEGNTDELEKFVGKIRESERKSTEQKVKALDDVAKAISMYRGDFLRLVLKMNDAASYQGGAATRLGMVNFNPKSDDPMVPKFQNLIDVFVKMGDLLSTLMRSLGPGMEKAKKYCDQIDEVEEEVDNAYRTLESYLYGREDLDIRTIMQLREIIKHIEEACDHVQSTADSVRIIIATH